MAGYAWRHYEERPVFAAAASDEAAPQALPPPPPEARENNAAPDEDLPVPPEPPRIAEGEDYERCLAMLRQSPETARTMAEAWEKRGGGDGAKHCLALSLLALGQPEIGARRLEALADESHANGAARASVLGQAGQAWMMAGQPDRAYGAITMALGITPHDTALMIDRAVAAGTLGRYAEAIEDLDRVLEVDGDRVEAWVFRAAALRHLDRTQAAMQDIARALELDPQNAEALLERGILRQMAGDTAGARVDWEKVVELSPDSPTADLAQQNLALNQAGPARR